MSARGTRYTENQEKTGVTPESFAEFFKEAMRICSDGIPFALNTECADFEQLALASLSRRQTAVSVMRQSSLPVRRVIAIRVPV